MGNEMQDFEKANLVLEPTEAPTLTLDPDLGETEPTAVSVPEPEKKQEVKAKMPALSPEEQKMVDDFAAKIDITNTNQILQYGAGTQKKMADFSDAALENVKTQDLGEVGDLISSVVGDPGERYPLGTRRGQQGGSEAGMSAEGSTELFAACRSIEIY